MKYFGTVKWFDEAKGRGSIAPETGGDALQFESSAFSWEPKIAPTVGQRLSYALAHRDGKASAVDLATL